MSDARTGISFFGRGGEAIVGSGRSALLAFGVAILTIFGAGSLCAAGPIGDLKVFHPSNGAQLALPPIDTLDCRGLEDVLLMISRVGYREISPARPEHPGDRELYEYEHAAAARHFELCMLVPDSSQAMPFFRRPFAFNTIMSFGK